MTCDRPLPPEHAEGCTCHLVTVSPTEVEVHNDGCCNDHPLMVGDRELPYEITLSPDEYEKETD